MSDRCLNTEPVQCRTKHSIVVKRLINSSSIPVSSVSTRKPRLGSSPWHVSPKLGRQSDIVCGLYLDGTYYLVVDTVGYPCARCVLWWCSPLQYRCSVSRTHPTQLDEAVWETLCITYSKFSVPTTLFTCENCMFAVNHRKGAERCHRNARSPGSNSCSASLRNW